MFRGGVGTLASDLGLLGDQRRQQRQGLTFHTCYTRNTTASSTVCSEGELDPPERATLHLASLNIRVTLGEILDRRLYLSGVGHWLL